MATTTNHENQTLLTMMSSHVQASQGGGSSPIVSNELMQTITFVNFSVLCTSVAFFGIVANIVNITVFVKIGFHDTVNMSLFVLATADMASLCFLIWVGTCFNPYLRRHLVPLEPTQVVYLTGGQPRLYFTRVAGWITSVIALERCVCVLKPMQVKLIFTRSRLMVVLASIFIAALLTMVPVYYTTRLSWKFYPGTNRSYLGLTFIENRHQIDRVSYALGVTVSISAFTIVTVCTLILGWSLIRQSQWRAKTALGEKVEVSKNSNDNKKNKGSSKVEISARDRQAVRTVTFIAAMFVICLSPNAMNLILMSTFPEYNKEARYQNIFLCVWSFAQLTEAIGSSSNIFVYLKTSTKFKETFIKLLNMNKPK